MKIAIVGLSNAVLLAQHNGVVALDTVSEKVALLDRKKYLIEDKEIEDFIASTQRHFRAVCRIKINA